MPAAMRLDELSDQEREMIVRERKITAGLIAMNELNSWGIQRYPRPVYDRDIVIAILDAADQVKL
jgi:hypothetical protein